MTMVHMSRGIKQNKQTEYTWCKPVQNIIRITQVKKECYILALSLFSYVPLFSIICLKTGCNVIIISNSYHTNKLQLLIKVQLAFPYVRQCN